MAPTFGLNSAAFVTRSVTEWVMMEVTPSE
jgi:hypothetical protein